MIIKNYQTNSMGKTLPKLVLRYKQCEQFWNQYSNH